MDSVAYDMNFTVELQSEFTDGYLPTLDTKLKLTSDQPSQVIYKFYKKPMASCLGILKTSALSEQIKSSTATQEFIRRLKNTSEHVEQPEINNTLEEYISQLYMSGYSREDMKKYAVAALVGYQRILKSSREGGTPLHRPGAVIRKGTFKKSLGVKTNWYKSKTKQEHKKYTRCAGKKTVRIVNHQHQYLYPVHQGGN